MEPEDIVKAQLMDARDLDRTLDRMARQIVEVSEPGEPVGLVGMQTRGVHIARRLHDKIRAADGIDIPVGVLDVTMYRDDFRNRLKQPTVRTTHVPYDVSGRRLFLVDDVLYTGRTARAALDALMDMGRPSGVYLLVIVDRGLRELPIRADIVGREVPTLPGEEVRVRVSEIDDRDGVWLVEHPRA